MSAMLRLKRLAALFIAAGVLAGVGGCATLGNVQPWEKGNLAKPEMTFGEQPMTRYSEHIYTSREAASGGAGVGGGGCGCN
jgi:hypothetical protein